MHSANALLLLSIALVACASTNAHQPAARPSAPAFAQPTNRTPARLGPPSPRGMSLRRVDRPTAAEPPLALY